MLVEMARPLAAGLGIELPKFTAGSSVRGQDAVGGRGQIEHGVRERGGGGQRGKAVGGVGRVVTARRACEAGVAANDTGRAGGR